MEEQKKKRGRPKKIISDTSINETTEVQVEKKKRGRPKKYNPYREFSDNIENIFKTYIEDYNDIILKFLSYKDKDIRISQDDWNTIYNHIKDITGQFNANNEENDNVFYIINADLHYKTNSSWKAIDNIREQDRIKYVDYFYNNTLNKEDTVYNGYMIYSHMKLYISESSKEYKI